MAKMRRRMIDENGDGEIIASDLIPDIDFFVSNLSSAINRVIFGSMIALAHITHLDTEKLFAALSIIIDAMDKGTVVTRDHGFRIMILLYQDINYQDDMFVLIQEQLLKAPSNQLGQYTERLILVLNKKHLNSFIETLEERRNDIANEYHLARLKKNLKKLYKQL